MFHRKNAGVSRDPLRETRIPDGDQCHTTVDYNWKPIDSMKNVLDCIVNYGISMQYVWTQDFTGYVFIKLFNNFNWLAYNGLQQQNRGNNPQSNRGGGSSQRGSASSSFKRPPAKTPSGRFICHNFSRGGSAGCSRPKVQNGCKDPNSGEEYAHCCSWFNTNSGTYCFLGHSKSQHK